MRTRVAKRYALALLGLAADHKQIEEWGAELERLARIVDAPEVLSQIASPELLKAARIEVVSKIVERLGLSFPVRSFAVVLARHGRIDQTAAAAEAYQALMDEKLGRARARLTFATKPEAAEVARVIEGLERMSGKKILPTVEVDGNLLGGVVAQLQGKTYDASLANRLYDAQRRMSV